MNSLFRYISAVHVDSFFRTGELRLTTYERCRTIEDESRRDTQEGELQFFVRSSEDGAPAMAGVHGVGRRSYLLCLSEEHSVRLAAHFKEDSVFAINDVEAFAEEIGKCLPKGASLKKVEMGGCRYKERSIEATRQLSCLRVSPELSRALAANDDGEIRRLLELIPAMMAQDIHSVIQDDGYFIKGPDHAHEKEFRIVWTVDAEVDGPAHVFCPSAIKHCERVR